MLSVRQQQFLEGLAAGKCPKHIGRDLNIAPSTAKNHMRALCKKLDAKSQAQCVAVGFRKGLLT